MTVEDRIPVHFRFHNGTDMGTARLYTAPRVGESVYFGDARAEKAVEYNAICVAHELRKPDWADVATGDVVVYLRLVT